MSNLVEELERRDHARLRCRLACSLLVDGARREGVLRDLGPGGVFVQTDAEIVPGAPAVVVFVTPEGERFVLEGWFPELRKVGRSLRGAVSDGALMRIHDPPVAWLRYVAGSGPEASA